MNASKEAQQQPWTEEELEQTNRDVKFENETDAWIQAILARGFGKDIRRNLECHRTVVLDDLPPTSLVVSTLGVDKWLITAFLAQCSLLGIPCSTRKTTLRAYAGPHLGMRWNEMVAQAKCGSTEPAPSPITESSPVRTSRLEASMERIEKLLENLAVDASFAPGGQTATDAAASFKKAATGATTATPL